MEAFNRDHYFNFHAFFKNEASIIHSFFFMDHNEWMGAFSLKILQWNQWVFLGTTDDFLWNWEDFITRLGEATVKRLILGFKIIFFPQLAHFFPHGSFCMKTVSFILVGFHQNAQHLTWLWVIWVNSAPVATSSRFHLKNGRCTELQKYERWWMKLPKKRICRNCKSH